MRRKFTGEFKAVRLVLKEGQVVAQVARDLDLAESVLHGWVKQAKVDRGIGPAGALTTEEREELSRLRKENRVLKEQKEILRNAAVRRRPGTRFRCRARCCGCLVAVTTLEQRASFRREPWRTPGWVRWWSQRTRRAVVRTAAPAFWTSCASEESGPGVSA